MQRVRRKGRMETGPTLIEANPCDASHDCREHGEDLGTGRTQCVKTDLYFVTNSPTPVPKYRLDLRP